MTSDVRLNTNTSGLTNSRYNQIRCDGQNVYVSWTEDRTTSSYEIRFQKSANGGATWLANDTRVDAASSGDRKTLQMTGSGQRIYLVWADTRNSTSNRDIYANASSDGGTSWLSTDVRLNTNTAGSALQQRPRICCDGANVHVLWHDGRSTKDDVRYSRSTNGGANWLASDVRLDTDVAGAADSDTPEICCDGANVYAVWVDDRNGTGSDTYFNRSTNAGASWLQNDVRISTDTAGQANNYTPGICCGGGAVFVAWEDERDDAFGDIRFTCSRDAGATWLTNDILLNDDSGTRQQSDARLCSDGARCCIGWEDMRHNVGTDDLYVTATRP